MANPIVVKDLLDAGVHFGHLTRRWNPNMAPYVYMERNGIHIINLYKTVAKMEEAGEALSRIAASGRKILFVATKKQAKEIVAQESQRAQMPYITERWPGGMLTNFVTIRKSVKKMATVDRMKKDGTFNSLSKKERLQVDRMRAKLEKNLGSISEMSRLPAAIFVVDTLREHIAVKEAQKLNIPVFALVDTNSNPRDVDYAIPANDDASKSIHKVMSYMTDSILEGLNERKDGKDSGEDKPAKAKKEANADEKPAKAEKKATAVEEAPENKAKEETNTEAQPANAEEKAAVVEEVPTEKAEPKKPAGEENKASE
ncbi:SSU ribosomal protein S2p (SAe) RpsB [Psychroflexus torquis ATCC 700755]|uniref:Small ribosomal subunit protein uS2 n=1 Tax=Psychroflexus torquis (strain ATCC 700755 / CIP 106069 / ACAM 623) TaxID=313595 RepID=K4IEX6_PSYTT|nr:30S ribosomal protein S2 [Psychroflexus torquis]AFU69092.1 SSU ribosomal protein S2p (SAe) RpsB [Psychroflexus torquis ATCC 700755]